MEENENKSLEDLKSEDYLVGRKGGAGTASAGGLFGAPTATPPQPAAGELFGVTSSTGGGLFYQQNESLFGMSGFGATTTTAEWNESVTVTSKANTAVIMNDNDDDTITPVDDSLAVVNTRKRTPVEDSERDATPAPSPRPVSSSPPVLVLTAEGYYTIPPLSHLTLDKEGQCLVTGFTVGREGYGNIHYPGILNVANLNLDDTVYIRHKEVIVYPDDLIKPPLGEGLNRSAQITLDKVWPLDKSNGDTIRSPDRLKNMRYEEKLERASKRLGARFIAYRPETGSWVFKVCVAIHRLLILYYIFFLGRLIIAASTG